MQHCTFCGSELPNSARFCGHCGHTISNATEGPTSISDVLTASKVVPDTPPVISRPEPAYGMSAGSEMSQADAEPTIRTDWLEKGMGEDRQIFEESQTLRPDLLWPGMAGGNVPGFGGDVPMVQGTPQAGGVPTVQGTPPGLSAPPQHMPNPQTPPQHLASQASFPRNVHTPPPNHGAGMQSPPHPHPPHSPHLPYSHEPHPTPTPPHHPHAGPHPHPARAYEHQEAYAHHAEAHRFGWTRGSRKLMLGTTTKWVIVVVAAIVVAVTSGVLAVIALNPSATLSLSGSSNVPLGGVLSLHGKGFTPGASVALTLDAGTPLASAESGLAKKSVDRAVPGAGLATTSLLLHTGQAELLSSQNAPGIPVSSEGTFDIQLVVRLNWSLGQHTLHARETNSSRSADLTFNVVGRPAKLVINPATLDFGSLEVGTKVFQSIVIANAGGQKLNWTADTGGTNWLRVLGSRGAIEPGGPQEFIYVMADTTHLSVGDYSATLAIQSNGGKQQVGVKLSVIPSTIKQAKLSVNPLTLDFGDVPIGQQATLGLTVSNIGTQALNWKADTGGTNWLSLDVNAGTINAGQQPQVIQVTVDATSLSLGNQTATLSFNSNGGTEQVGITLNVRMRAKPPAPILTSSPSGFSVPGDQNCTYDVNAGWTCVASLSSYKSALVNLDWTAASSGVNGVSFAPSSGTLTPGQTAKVTISIPNTVCPTSADFMFTGPGNTLDLPWSCGATSWSVSPSAFNANTDCTFSNGWTCLAMLSSDQHAQGYLGWSASGSGIKSIGFTPSSGTLAPGQTTQVVIAIPNTVCPANANLSFAGQKTNIVTVPWSCVPPTLVISKANFNANTDCTFSNGWTCTEMLSLGSNNPGDPNLNWSASGNGISGIGFSPSSGTLASGQTTQVTITVPNTTCPASASLSFAGQSSNTAIASWSCSPVSLQASKTSFDGNTDCTYDSHNGWTCTETLSLSSNNPGDPSLNWSTSSSGIGGITFSPSSGTLASGQTAQVTITVPPTNCPASANLSFAAQGANTVTVSWSCSPVTLQVSKTSFDGNSDCTYDSTNGWTCTEMLSLSSNNPGDPSLNWSASSSGISGITFSPANGIVSSGQTVQVTISVPNTSCPNNATFTFATSSNTVNVPWSCAGQSISASPSSFTANSDCTLGANSTWSCVATVSSSANAQGNLNWSTSSSGVSGITFSPPNGVLTPGQSTQVTIAVPTTCPASATLTFNGPVNMVGIPWKCNAPTLAGSPTSFNIPDANCTYTAGSGWSCTTMLTNQDNQQNLSWSATSSGIGGISVSPASGTLNPGQTSPVTIFVPDTTCPASATITFTGPANQVNVSWNCSAPSLTIDPSSFSNTSCTQNSDGSWTCSETVSLAQGSQGDLNWSATSSLSGVTFNPQSGTLLSSSPSISVSINIPSNDCTSGSFTFAGQGQGANSATASWSCTPPSLILSVSPSSFDTSNCSNSGSAWSCVATLSSSSSNTGNLNWSATSNMPSAVGFTPSSGTLSPGQSVLVTATIPVTCPASVTLMYIGPANTVNVPFSC